MTRKKKAALNQAPVVEQIEEVKVSEEVVETLEKNHGVDVVEEVKKIIPEAKITIGGAELVAKPTEEKITQEDMDLDKYDMTIHSDVYPPVEEAPVPMGVTEDGTPSLPDSFIEEDEEEEKPPRTMASLSKAELRWFQRTGMMPK